MSNFRIKDTDFKELMECNGMVAKTPEEGQLSGRLTHITTKDNPQKSIISNGNPWIAI